MITRNLLMTTLSLLTMSYSVFAQRTNTAIKINRVSKSKNYDPVDINITEKKSVTYDSIGRKFVRETKIYSINSYRALGSSTHNYKIISDSIYAQTEYTLSERKRIYKDAFYKAYRKSVFFRIEISYTPSIANRGITVGNYVTDNKRIGINKRNNNERATLGWRYDCSLGASFRLAHTVYIAPFILRQGFKSIEDSVDWRTGLSYESNSNKEYAFDYAGAALGYKYSGYQRKFNFTFDGAVYYMLLTNSKNLTNNTVLNLDKEITGREKDAFGFRLGAGFNYRPSYKCEVFFIPNFNVNLTSVNRNGEIWTNLRNTGITIGTSYLIGR